MALKPLHDRVLIERVDADKVTASGIVIPDTAAEKAEQGTVLAVGNGKHDAHGNLVALTVQPGDRVLFGKFAGQTVKVDGKEFLVVREEEILAIVEQ